MAGTYITIAATDSAKFDSYFASPVSDKGAGVVIVSTISGVDSDMTYYADALARPRGLSRLPLTCSGAMLTPVPCPGPTTVANEPSSATTATISSWG